MIFYLTHIDFMKQQHNNTYFACRSLRKDRGVRWFDYTTRAFAATFNICPFLDLPTLSHHWLVHQIHVDTCTAWLHFETNSDLFFRMKRFEFTVLAFGWWYFCHLYNFMLLISSHSLQQTITYNMLRFEHNDTNTKRSQLLMHHEGTVTYHYCHFIITLETAGTFPFLLFWKHLIMCFLSLWHSLLCLQCFHVKLPVWSSDWVQVNYEKGRHRKRGRGATSLANPPLFPN